VLSDASTPAHFSLCHLVQSTVPDEHGGVAEARSQEAAARLRAVHEGSHAASYRRHSSEVHTLTSRCVWVRLRRWEGQIAEDLYQRGFLSYPRTETTVFQQGTDFHALIKEQASDREWGQYAQSYVETTALPVHDRHRMLTSAVFRLGDCAGCWMGDS